MRAMAMATNDSCERWDETFGDRADPILGTVDGLGRDRRVDLVSAHVFGAS